MDRLDSGGGTMRSEKLTGKQALLAALDSIISRIVATIDEERSVLASAGAAEFQSLIVKKDYLALELMRLSRQPMCLEMRARCESLRSALERHGEFLRLHVEAVSEINGFVVAAMQHAAGDGTYTSDVKNSAQQ